MAPRKQDSETDSLLIDFVATVLCLAIVGAIAWVILLFRGRGAAPDLTLIAVVLGCLAVAIMGPKIWARRAR